MRQVVLLLLAPACSPAPADPDPTLLEAVDGYTGVAGTVDDARARELLEGAAARGGPLATMWLARVHSTGRMGFPRDGNGRARSPHTQLRLGEAYEAGRGVPRDLKRAEEWYVAPPPQATGRRRRRWRDWRGRVDAWPARRWLTKKTSLSSFCPSI